MKHKLPMFYGASMELFKFAEKMRYAPTKGEEGMWSLLKTEPLTDYKFRRQHPIARYIADFYSHQLKLVIEIDGGYHRCSFQKEYDDFRDEDMQELGISVIRFTNEDVLQNNTKLLKRLLEEIQSLRNDKI